MKYIIGMAMVLIVFLLLAFRLLSRSGGASFWGGGSARRVMEGGGEMGCDEQGKTLIEALKTIEDKPDILDQKEIKWEEIKWGDCTLNEVDSVEQLFEELLAKE
jgi:hypothetical protein